MAVGWSDDLLAYASRTPGVRVMVPTSGTTLWADVWTVPARAGERKGAVGPSPMLPQW